jgi:hypothetical protein
MHTLIYALVRVSTRNHALRDRKTVFDRLIGTGTGTCGVFDYYACFDAKGTTTGEGRWGDLPAAVPAQSLEGARFIERGWTATEQAFRHNLAPPRDTFHRLGAREEPTPFLYDEDGSGIRDPDHLDQVLADRENLWIVPADVHY